ncbi:tellurite resistance TerB family protein [Rheinheimera pleomorphica]|uniref:tellurite resistance TerB family protein n=1 Tax=Rheinheimera pleomorphica TaxID=2703963 RepID=UPI00141D959D|nr:tellurite resistance TerB family protein [Rheinheimera pleomorphica]
MNTKGLLDQLFKQGSELLSGNSKTSTSGSSGLGGLLSGRGGAALGGGALGLLLGSKKGRKMGGKILTYGGLAALGVVAYKAYSNYQQQQQTAASRSEPQTIDRLPAPQAEQHSHAILRAIIGAAKADGHIDDRERELIDNEIARLTTDDSLQQWFDAELRKPLDPADIAKSASTPEMAAEMYLASVLVVDEESFMERSYLTELARQLKLEPALKAELEQQARQAAA